MPATASAPTANESETIGIRQIVSAFSPVFPHFRILQNLVIPLPADSPVPTAEFDAVVICEAGLYLFEIKGWRDAYVYREKRADDNTQWFLRPHGSKATIEVQNPGAQGGRKMVQLRTLLPERMRVHYYVLLPCGGIELEPAMPAGILTSADLPYVARVIRSSSRSSKISVPLDAQAIELTAQMLFELQGDLTVAQHIRNCQFSRERQAAHAAHGGAAASPSQCRAA